MQSGKSVKISKVETSYPEDNLIAERPMTMHDLLIYQAAIDYTITHHFDEAEDLIQKRIKIGFAPKEFTQQLQYIQAIKAKQALAHPINNNPGFLMQLRQKCIAFFRWIKDKFINFCRSFSINNQRPSPTTSNEELARSHTEIHRDESYNQSTQILISIFPQQASEPQGDKIVEQKIPTSGYSIQSLSPDIHYKKKVK